MSELFQKKHELWLYINFASFSINDEEIKSRLYDFSQIAFRHMKWISSDILENNENYDFSKIYLSKISLNTISAKFFGT